MNTTITPTPALSRRRVNVSDSVLQRLARVSSGSLTTQLYKEGIRQPVLVGLRPLQGGAVNRFAGRAYTMRFIPAREDIDSYANARPPRRMPTTCNGSESSRRRPAT